MTNKNKEMWKTFLGVMQNKQESVNSIIPNCYVKDVYDIDYDNLYEKGYRNIIFDIDNTILPVDDINVSYELIELFNKIKSLKFNICVVSNNNEGRVISPASKLNVLYLANANKPKEEAFDKALELLKGDKNNTIMVGDQMLSDIKGANDYGLYTILVDPLCDKYNFKTKVSRVLQNTMEKKLAKRNVFHKNSYYK